MDELRGQVATIIESVWTTMLGVAIESSSTKLELPDEVWTSCVNISGAWNGMVALHCPSDLAVKVTSQMFGLDGKTPDAGQVRDALGELANMAGGNIKALMPEPSTLSLPIVSAGSRNQVGFPNAAPLVETFFVSEGLPICVTVWQGAR